MEFNLDVLNVVLGLNKAETTASVVNNNNAEGSPRKQNVSSESLLRRSTNVINFLKMIFKNF